MRTLFMILAVLFLASLSTAASAAPSRLLLETIVDEDVTLTLTNEEVLRGKVVRVLDDGVIFIQDSGDVLELANDRIHSTRLTHSAGASSAPPTGTPPPAVEAAAAAVEEPTRPPNAEEPRASGAPAHGHQMTPTEAERVNAERPSSVRPRGVASPPAPEPARQLSLASSEPNINAYGRGLSGAILLVHGAALATTGLALVIHGERRGNEDYSPGELGAVMLVAALPAVAVGATLLVLGKNKRARAIAARAPRAITIGPSFAQGRPGAQLRLQF